MGVRSVEPDGLQAAPGQLPAGGHQQVLPAWIIILLGMHAHVRALHADQFRSHPDHVQPFSGQTLGGMFTADAHALGAVGGVLANRWLITVGAVILLAGAGYALRCRVRRRRGAGPVDCCPTVPTHPRRRRARNLIVTTPSE